MSLVRLKPFCADYLWGGIKLRTQFGIDTDKDKVAEAWVLSCNSNGNSIIETVSDGMSEYNGLTLMEYIRKRCDKEYNVLGTNADKFNEFPILTKLIDAKENLSIQVHPDNKYALATEGEYGKTEMWYIIDAEPGAKIYYGVSRDVTKDEIKECITNNTITDILKEVEVRAGDCYFIPSGTIHAICKGALIAEVQQNSNVTYRLYDYNRTDKDGNTRELHIDKALDVVRVKPNYNKYDFGEHLVSCCYFTTDLLKGNIKNEVTEKSFVSLVILSGKGKIRYIENGKEILVDVKIGESYFIDANYNNDSKSDCYYEIEDDGNLSILKTQIGRF